MQIVYSLPEMGNILFILPAHTSNVLQSMDVSCYGPYERIYNVLRQLMTESSAIITRYICEIACKTYSEAVSSENIQFGFKCIRIYPLNCCSVSGEYRELVEDFNNCSSQDSLATVEGGVIVQDDVSVTDFDIVDDVIAAEDDTKCNKYLK